MEKHRKLSDEEFEKQFSACTFDRESFTHEAHLRLAWIHVTKYGVDKAINNITSQIKAYVEFLGAQDKYNETVTVAAIRAVYHFVLRSESGSFQDLITEHPRLKYKFKELLFAHYSTDIFNSEIAKKEYLEPELVPFD